MPQATQVHNTPATERVRELKELLRNQILTLRHATRAVSDYAKSDCGYTPVSMEWLTQNLATEARRLYDLHHDLFIADRRARGIPDPTLPAGVDLEAAE